MAIKACSALPKAQIQFNDEDDSLSKSAINMTPDKNIKTPYTDLKPTIKQIVTKEMAMIMGWKSPQ